MRTSLLAIAAIRGGCQIRCRRVGAPGSECSHRRCRGRRRRRGSRVYVDGIAVEPAPGIPRTTLFRRNHVAAYTIPDQREIFAACCGDRRVNSKLYERAAGRAASTPYPNTVGNTADRQAVETRGRPAQSVMVRYASIPLNNVRAAAAIDAARSGPGHQGPHRPPVSPTRGVSFVVLRSVPGAPDEFGLRPQRRSTISFPFSRQVRSGRGAGIVPRHPARAIAVAKISDSTSNSQEPSVFVYAGIACGMVH